VDELEGADAVARDAAELRDVLEAVLADRQGKSG
jgi:hypothetical protein